MQPGSGASAEARVSQPERSPARLRPAQPAWRRRARSSPAEDRLTDGQTRDGDLTTAKTALAQTDNKHSSLPIPQAPRPRRRPGKRTDTVLLPIHGSLAGRLSRTASTGG